MPSYMSPGVYVEEVPSGSAPIAGVGTSTAGFIGVVPDDASMPSLPDGSQYRIAPAGEPQLAMSIRTRRRPCSRRCPTGVMV